MDEFRRFQQWVMETYGGLRAMSIPEMAYQQDPLFAEWTATQAEPYVTVGGERQEYMPQMLPPGAQQWISAPGEAAQPSVTVGGEPQTYMPQMLPPGAQQWIASGQKAVTKPKVEDDALDIPSFPPVVEENWGGRRVKVQYDEYGKLVFFEYIDPEEAIITPLQQKQFDWQKTQWQQQMGMDAQRLAAESEMERQRILASLSGPRDWVKYSKYATGQTPITPEWMPNWAPEAQAGARMTPEWFRTPSAQQWTGASPTIQEMVLGGADYAASMGASRTGEDIMGHMRQMIPTQGRGAGKETWIPARQR